MSIDSDGEPQFNFLICLAPSEPDYWVFYDVTQYKGKVMKIRYEGNQEGLSKIYQSDSIDGQDTYWIITFHRCRNYIIMTNHFQV